MNEFWNALRDYISSDVDDPFAVEIRNDTDRVSLEELGFTVHGKYATISKTNAKELLESYQGQFDFKSYWSTEITRWGVKPAHQRQENAEQ